MRKIPGLICTSALCASLLGSAVSVSAAFDPNTGKGNLIIEEAGTYTLTGNMHGSVYVNPGAGDVELIMDNAHIDGGETSGIIVNSGDSVKITLKENTENTISGMGKDSDYLAAIYSKTNLTFAGDGKLTVNCAGENGIRTEGARMTFDCGNMEIFCKGEAFLQDGELNGQIFYEGGNIMVNGMTLSPEDIDKIIEEDKQAADNQQAQKTQQTDSKQSGQQSGNSQQGQQSQPGGNAQQDQPGQTNNSTQQNQQNGNTQQNQTSDSTQQDQQNQPSDNTQQGQTGDSTQQGQFPGQGTQQPGNIADTLSSAESASEIVTGTVTNSAADLVADTENATYITVSDDNSQVSISESGTYVISGSSSDGNIVVKKGTTGVVLVLEDLDLTSTTGATLSVNKESEVQIVVSGNVTLTDAENPEDEESEDEEVADAYDGAAIKIKADSDVYITGDGTLTLNGTAKNGIKCGDDSTLVIDGELTMTINAANDGINSNYDVAILSGELVINAVDDAVHADHILTIGKEDGTGPTVEIVESTEGLEATVVNIYGGDIDINASDDAINAANSDGIYEDELTYSINMMGGTVDINSVGDGFDSNGNVNLIDGTANIQSGSTGGEAGIDYDGQLNVSDEFELYNNSGVSGADMMPGDMSGQMPGDMNGQMPGDTDSQTTDTTDTQVPGDMSGQMPSDMGSQTTDTTDTQMPGDMSGQMPSDMGSQTTDTTNAQMPGNMNGQMPGAMNGQMPSDMNSQTTDTTNTQMPGNMNGQMPVGINVR